MTNEMVGRTPSAGQILAAGCAGLMLAAMAPATASAAVTVLNFTGACTFGCSNGTPVLQTYGDSEGLNVSYRSINTQTGATHEPFLKTWGLGYGDLETVIWGGADRLGYSSEIVFDVADGYEIRLIGFDFASYSSGAESTLFDIASLDGAAYYDGRYASTRTGHNYFSANTAFSQAGIRLGWGPDGYEVGLDNIAFEVRRIENPTGAVPEPGTWALMILGFMGVGWALRRRSVPLVA